MTAISNENPEPKMSSFENPWWFVPSLYFAQGIPVMLIQSMLPILFKDFHLENKEIAVFTTIISWPWVLKMLWGPLVDQQATRRAWILGTQALIAVAMFLAAFSIILPNFLPYSLSIFFVTAFLSATCDIATDGFYLLALNSKDRASFVGLQSAFFRLGSIFTTSGLVWIAGRLGENGVSQNAKWAIAIAVGSAVYLGLLEWNRRLLPKPDTDLLQENFKLGRIAVVFFEVIASLAAIFLLWRLGYMALGPSISQLFGYHFDDPVAKFGTPLFLEKASQYSVLSLPVQLGISLVVSAFGVMGALSMFRETGMAVPAKMFFKMDKILAILSFILFFRFGESMISTMASPFYQDTIAKGGMGLSLGEVGKVVGVVGIIALTAGGLLGGYVIGKIGIKKCLWPMILALNIPNLAYVYFGLNNDILPKFSAMFLVGIDQFGYGFGFSAYLVYLLFVCQDRPMSTSLYAIATGMMALGAMFARLFSGFVFDVINKGGGAHPYGAFFVTVVLMGIPGMLTLFFIPKNKSDIKVSHVAID